MRRVVVTGLGMVSPLACGVEPTWKRLLAGENGAGPASGFETSDLPCKIACQVPRGDGPDQFRPDEWMDPREQRRVDDFIVYAMAAATQALRDADWAPATEGQRCATGT
ncbi:MAG: beta-ketoacyl-ACP synthase II, partial [Hyphomicrobiales bacterium]|nr:beta-ketoacyl-ACP synthase II [Hyphomicrobiales bacterium]